MFGFIKSLFSSSPDKIIDSVNGIGGWIDGQQFTEQEKSQASMKVLEYKLKWINATQGMNLARRYLALMFCLTFLFTFIAGVLSVIAGFWFNINVSELILNITKLVSIYKLDYITGSIIIFYFGKGILENRK